jgi:hypothetical protein
MDLKIYNVYKLYNDDWDGWDGVHVGVEFDLDGQPWWVGVEFSPDCPQGRLWDEALNAVGSVLSIFKMPQEKRQAFDPPIIKAAFDFWSQNVPATQ